MPTPGINQVLIKMKSSGICGSDVHYIYHQHRATAAAPDKPLYQDLSTVMNRAADCGDGQAAAILKRATACWCITFLAVVFARTAVAVFLFLVLAEGKAAYGWQRDGGHAEYLLAEEKDLILLPDALSYEDGAFISCGVGTAYEGIFARRSFRQ